MGMKKPLFNNSNNEKETKVEIKYDKQDAKTIKEAILKYKKENKKS